MDFGAWSFLRFRYTPLVQKPTTATNSTCWGLLRRRQCLVPTWRGLLVGLLGVVVVAVVFVRNIYSFLTPNDPAPGGVLVVEGWVPDWALEATVAEVHRHHYDKVFVTGIPIQKGAPFVEYHTDAELGAALLVKMGLSSNVVQAVPAPDVRRDRTYACAASLSRWFRDHQFTPTNVNLITEGPHARRSRMLFQRALGKPIKVGTLPVETPNFDSQHWWRSSYGVRSVIGESLAYAYARLLFQTPKDE
jgi:hypothetical protein